MSRLLTPGQLWLYRTKPRDDEIFSSWLVRLAWGCAIQLQTFCTKVLSQSSGFLSQDIDRKISALVQQRLYDGTGSSSSQIQQTTLDAYEGILWDERVDASRRRRVPWVMPIGRYGRYRLGFGQQYCRLCLAEDEVPYFRRRWRLSLTVACVRHRIHLRDACPRCAGPIVFHTGDFNRPRLPWDCPIVRCGHCEHDLRVVFNADDAPIDANLLSFQQRLSVAIVNGFDPMLPGGENYSLLFFNGFRQLIGLLVSNARTLRLRNYLLAQLGGLPLSPCNTRGEKSLFEELRLGDRVEAMRLALMLIDDWPNCFIEVCKASRVSSSYLTNSRPQHLPYWFTCSVREHLYDEDYSPTQTERSAVIDYLTKSGFNVCENEIRRWLGLSHTPTKNKLKGQIQRWNPRGAMHRYV